MNQFVPKSKEHLDTCRAEIRQLAYAALPLFDHSITEGHRPESEHAAHVAAGRSKVSWAKSKHSHIPSDAWHAVPYPVIWPESKTDFEGKMKAYARFYFLAGIYKALAHEMGVEIRWGGDWDSDNDFFDQTFNDLSHYELVQSSQEAIA